MKTAKGPIRARCVISTVSNGVLAAQHIPFKPRLPDWKLGAENKVVVNLVSSNVATVLAGREFAPRVR